MPTQSSTKLSSVKPIADAQAPQNNPIPAVPANPDRFSHGKAIIVQVVPHIFVANKVGAQRFHKIVPNFTHILVRDHGGFASGHDQATSIRLNMKNQSKDMPMNWLTLDRAQDFFQTNAYGANNTVHAQGLHRALQICSAATANLPVLISCGSAVSRSPAFMMIYLIYRFDATYSDVTGWISTIANAAPSFKLAPAHGFLAQIKHHEQTLHIWHNNDGL